MNECNIVSDLMPLYADELASPDSVEYITRHIAWCPECAEVWKRLGTTLPEVDPREEAQNYRKAIRHGKRRIFLKSLALCLIVLVISVTYFAYTLYNMGYLLPIESSHPAPDGTRTLEIMDRNFFLRRSEGYMIRFHFENTDNSVGGANRYYTQWDTIDPHWAGDSVHLFLDVTNVDGQHSMHIIDTNVQTHQGGTWDIPGITEDLIPIFEEALRSEVDIGELTFSFGGWCDEGETAYFLYEMESGYVGTIDYHYPTATIKSIR